MTWLGCLHFNYTLPLNIYNYYLTFSNALIKALTKPIVTAIEEERLLTLQIFDAAKLVKLHCGKRNATGDIDLEQSEGEIK